MLKRPVIPDVDAVQRQISNIGIAGNEPKQLMNHRFEVYFFGGQQRKTRSEIESHLITENAERAGTRAVLFAVAVGENVPEQVVVCAHEWSVFG